MQYGIYVLTVECHAQETMGNTGCRTGGYLTHWGIWNGTKSSSSAISQVLKGKEWYARIREAGGSSRLL